MKNVLLAAVLAAPFATAAVAAPQPYVLNESHSQVLFTYNHAGFSTTFGMYSGFGGDMISLSWAITQMSRLSQRGSK